MKLSTAVRLITRLEDKSSAPQKKYRLVELREKSVIGNEKEN